MQLTGKLWWADGCCYRTQVPFACKRMCARPWLAILCRGTSVTLNIYPLCSVSINHVGAPKIWYGSPASAAGAAERCVSGEILPQGVGQKEALKMLVGKNVAFFPHVLASQGVPVARVVQHAGEIVVTFPFAYHEGFNAGDSPFCVFPFERFSGSGGQARDRSPEVLVGSESCFVYMQG
jgi:hypothetical protein